VTILFVYVRALSCVKTGTYFPAAGARIIAVIIKITAACQERDFENISEVHHFRN